MTKVALLLLTLTLAARPAHGQNPTGSIAGAVSDATGGPLTDARVTIVHADTEQRRIVTTSADGLFTAAALPSGVYRLTIEAPGFEPAEHTVTVAVGTTSTLELTLDLPGVSERLTVRGDHPLIRRDHHQAGGVVTQDQIERLPLNGRNSLELAEVEPGVVPSRTADGRSFVAVLGAGLQTIPRIGATWITLDGTNIATPGTTGVLLQVSPDVVHEFQMTTVNFDAMTGPTSNGSINMLTRSGTNAYRGSGFEFFRNHHLAAYPALSRDPANPNPAFERHQFGGSAGGPIRKGRVFFFASFERTDQTSVVTVELPDEFRSLGGIFQSPYDGNQFNARVDGRLREHHNAFVRYTSDRNTGLGGSGRSLLPSSWGRRLNEAWQVAGGVTSVFSNTIVNEVRVASFSTETPASVVTAEDCHGCFGLGEIRTIVSGPGLTYGGTGTGATASGRRFQVMDTLTWQKGSHLLRFGADVELGTFTTWSVSTGALTLFSPADTLKAMPDFPLPPVFTTTEDILKLPLRNLSLTVGSGTVLWQDFQPERRIDAYRAFVNDSWRINGSLTLNAGLGWAYEPNALSHDLTKPPLLEPILGADGLRPPRRQTRNFSPSLGLTWTPPFDGKSVIRAGAGRYFDPAGSGHPNNLITERHLLSPLGTGTLTNSPLTYDEPTPFTGADGKEQYPDLRAKLEALLNPDNRDFSARNIDGTKTGTNLQHPDNRTPYAIHVGAGVQRELGLGIVGSADVVWKQFVHTFINGIDYNRVGSAGGRVIRQCTTPQQATDLTAVCSNGRFYFDTTIGRARYAGLLLRAQKRFSGRTQLLASYALGSFVGSNGTGTATSEAPGGRVFGFNNDDWFENYGPLPTDYRHMLNVSAAVQLPQEIMLAMSMSAYSAPPMAPYVSNADFNLDGTINDLLPGSTINQFRSSRDKRTLEALVAEYNQTIVNGGRAPTAPILALPESYGFNDSFWAHDLRLTRTFRLGAERRLALFAELFNAFNVANLTGVASDLRQRNTFGRPNARFTQVFGSGGPRAAQIGARFMF